MAGENTLLAVGLTALVVGGGVYYFTRRQAAAAPGPGPAVVPPGPPIVPPGPPPAPPPGPAPAVSELVRQTIEGFVAQLQTAGGGSPAQREQVAVALEAQANQLAVSGGRPEDVQALRSAAFVIRMGQTPTLPPIRQTFTTSTGHAVIAPELAMRYRALRDACARFLEGQAQIDLPTLGAADRTARDLYLIGDQARASDLGTLASASYARAGVPRPMAFSV